MFCNHSKAFLSTGTYQYFFIISVVDPSCFISDPDPDHKIFISRIRILLLLNYP